MARGERQYYCDSNRLHALLIERSGKKESPVCNELGKMFVDIVDGLLSKPNYNRYTKDWLESMRVTAITRLLKYSHHYDPEKGARIRASRDGGKYAPVDLGKTAFNYISWAANRCIFTEIGRLKVRSEKTGEKLYLDGKLYSLEDITESDVVGHSEIIESEKDPFEKKREDVAVKALEEYEEAKKIVLSKYFVRKGCIYKDWMSK